MKKLRFLLLALMISIMPINALAYSSKVILGGENVGIEIQSEGILIVGFYKINNSYNSSNLYLGDKIKKVQTPQAFKFDIIIEAHEKYEDVSVNDDASLLLMEHQNIKLVRGSPLNFKVTTNEDLKLLELILKGKYEL